MAWADAEALGASPNEVPIRRSAMQKGIPHEPLLAATQSKGIVRKEDYGARTVTAMKDFHLLQTCRDWRLRQ